MPRAGAPLPSGVFVGVVVVVVDVGICSVVAAVAVVVAVVLTSARCSGLVGDHRTYFINWTLG